jgi:hypothetical protein
VGASKKREEQNSKRQAKILKNEQQPRQDQSGIRKKKKGPDTRRQDLKHILDSPNFINICPIFLHHISKPLC